MHTISQPGKKQIYHSSIILSVVVALIIFLLGSLWIDEITKNVENQWLLKSEAANERIARIITNKIDQVRKLSQSVLLIDKDAVKNKSVLSPQITNMISLVDNNNNVSVALAPNGIVKYVYPDNVNQHLLGLNLLEKYKKNPLISEMWEGPFTSRLTLETQTLLIHHYFKSNSTNTTINGSLGIIEFPDSLISLPGVKTYADNKNDVHVNIYLGTSVDDLKKVYIDQDYNKNIELRYTSEWNIILDEKSNTLILDEVNKEDYHSRHKNDKAITKLFLKIDTFNINPLTNQLYISTYWVILYSLLIGIIVFFISYFYQNKKQTQENKQILFDLEKILSDSIVSQIIYKINGDFVWANNQFMELYKAPIDYLKKTNIYKSDWWLSTNNIEVLKRVSNTGKSETFEYTGPGIFNLNLDIRVIVSKIKISEKYCILIQTIDLMEDHRLLKEARESEKAKEEFLSVVSHELRTPLNSIFGMLQILNARNKSLDEKSKSYIEAAIDSSKLLLRIINDILDFSKINRKFMELDPIPNKLINIFDKVNMLVSSIEHSPNVSVIFDIDPLLTDEVLVDETRLEQILINLISNSMKFTESGTITITATLLDSNDDNSIKILISVSDTGIGMSEELISKLGKPFTQGDSSTTRKYGGTGLGLSIIMQLLKAMDSQLIINSLIGEGTTCKFTLDLPLTSKKHTIDDYTKNRSLSGKHILIVDDNSANRLTLINILETMGATTYTAINGYDALAQIKKYNNLLHAVLMDLQMPLMDGFQAAREIRKQYYNISNDSTNTINISKKLPIIAVTGNVNANIDEISKSGMDAIIYKPINVIELVKTILKFTDFN